MIFQQDGESKHSIAIQTEAFWFHFARWSYHDFLHRETKYKVTKPYYNDLCSEVLREPLQYEV